MIKTFRDADAERLWKKERSRHIPATLRRAAFKKLQMLNAAEVLSDMSVPPSNRLERLKETERGNTLSELMINTVSASYGATETLTTSRLRTNTEQE